MKYNIKTEVRHTCPSIIIDLIQYNRLKNLGLILENIIVHDRDAKTNINTIEELLVIYKKKTGIDDLTLDDIRGEIL